MKFRLGILLVGVVFGLGLFTMVEAYFFGNPTTPQPFVQNPEAASFDVQVHNRADPTGFTSMAAQHGSACQGPPATHAVSTYTDAVFVCNNHIMTALNGGPTSYALAVITPAQTLDCTTSCSVTWEMSTERQSTRDWPDVWLTPWQDNLTLPFDAGEVDLQGVPRNGLHVDFNNSQSAPMIKRITNYDETTVAVSGFSIQAGIAAGTNQAAVRQTFRLTVAGTTVRFERLASATAPALVFFDGGVASSPLGAETVVQFGHHSYDPAKDGAGVPATWHWSLFELSPATPFTLIKGSGDINSGSYTGGTVTFPQPAPANSYLRFSGLCKVFINGTAAPKAAFVGHPEHVAPYFMPIAAGTTSVAVSFGADDWYQSFHGGCRMQGAAIWSKQSSPSPTPSPPTPSPTVTVTSTTLPTTPTMIPAPTSTLVPTATVGFTPTPTVLPPTITPTTTAPILRQCTLRWGGNTIENYGLLSQADCAARGN